MAQAAREEIYNAIRKADAAGDADSVKKLAAYLDSMDQPESAPAAEQPKTMQRGGGIGSPGDILTGSVLPMVTTPVAGLAGLYGAGKAAIQGQDAAAAGVQSMERAQQAMTPAPTGSMLEKTGNIIGEGLSYIPHKLGEKAGEFALEQGASPAVATGANVAGNVLGMGLTGGLLKKGGQVTKATAQAATGEPVVVESMFTPENMAKLKEMRPKVEAPDGSLINADDVPQLKPKPVVTESGVDITPQNFENGLKEVVTPTMAERAKVLQSVGIEEPTRWQLTQKNEHEVLEQELAKGSNPLAERLATQSEAMKNTALRQADAFGGKAPDARRTGASVTDAVISQFRNEDAAINDAYKAAREKAGDAKVVGGQSVHDYIKSAISENLPDVDKTVAWAINQLKGRTLAIKDGDVVPEGTMSVNASELIRQRINEQLKPYYKADQKGTLNPSDYRQMHFLEGLKDAIVDDAAKAVGGDLFAEARQAKIDREALLKRTRTSEYDVSGGKSLVEKILKGFVDDHKIVDEIQSGKVRPADIAQLKNFLNNEAGAKGVQAWRNIQTQIFKDAIEHAKAGKTEGVLQYSPKRFANYFNGLEESGKLGIIYDDTSLIKNSKQAGELLSTGVRPSPSGQAIHAVGEGIMKTIAKSASEGGHEIGKMASIPVKVVAALRERSDLNKILNPLEKTKEALKK